MSKADILLALPKLSAGDRLEIWAKLNEMDDLLDDPLTVDEQKKVADRVADYMKYPTAVFSWNEAEARLNRRLGE